MMMYSKMVDKFDYINKVIAPGFARSNNFYNENSLFTLLNKEEYIVSDNICYKKVIDDSSFDKCLIPRCIFSICVLRGLCTPAA